ncbi:MAG: translocation/assembly module TamB domain-containing protein [bacterium]
MIRKAFLTAILSIVFLAVMVFYGWKLFKVNEGIKKFVISKLRSAIGEQCTIERLRFGLGTVDLEGVELAFQDSPYEVWIEALRFGYSIGSLLKGEVNLEKTAEEITLYKPRLTLLYNPKKYPGPNVDLSLELSNDAEKGYKTIIKEYDFIKRITISEGEIVLLDSVSSKETRVAKQINGWAYTDDKSRVWLRLAGHIFETEEYNMVLYGQLDLNQGGLDIINVDLHDYKIGNEIPFLLPNYFEVLDGVMNGHITLTERLRPNRGFDIAGTVSLRDGRLKLVSENLYIEDIYLDAELKNWNLEINRAFQTINGSPTELEGKIRNFLEPEFDLHLTSKHMDVEKFLSQFLSEKVLPFKGITTVDVTISDAISSPIIQGRIKSDSLGFFNQYLRDLEVDLDFKGFSLNFQDISGYLQGASLSGKGNVNFNVPEKWLNFNLAGSGDFTEDLHSLGLTSTDRCIGNFELEVLGSLMNPVSNGEFELHFSKETYESLTLEGTFRYSQGSFNLNSTSKNNDFHLTAFADSVFANPYFDLEATNFENLFVFVNDPKVEFIRNRYNLNMVANGDKNNFNLVIDGYRRDNYEKLFQIVTNNQLSKGNNLLEGEIVLFPNSPQNIEGDFELDVSKDHFRLRRFDLGDWIHGSFDFTNASDSPSHGKLSISGLKLSMLHSLLGTRTSKYDGNVYGQIVIRGDTEKPEYSGNLWLLDAFWEDIGPLKGELTFVADATRIEIKTLSLDKLEKPILRAGGSYDLKTKEVDAAIAGSDVNVSEVLKLLTGSEHIAEGQAVIQIRLKGKAPKVPIYGEIKVHNAKILMFEFHEAILDFGDENHENGSYLSTRALNVGNAVLKKDNEFVLQGTAQLPYSGDHAMNVQLSGDGNFLSLVSDIDDFFIDSSSQGHLDLHITGNYSRPKFMGSQFIFGQGALKLDGVAKNIDNLEGEFVVLHEDYFLDIKRLQGTIQGEPFSISNTNSLESMNHGVYEPLRIAGDELNLGALILETSPNGVPLNIPGLMEKGELGWFSFVGRSAGEAFVVAGPWERPLVRGEARIRNANLTYPFEGGSDGEESLVEHIMNNLNWDIRAVSEKDTRYVKQFPTAIYVNVEVDRENSALEFTGVLRDSTFRIVGNVESTRGAFEYFDLNFRVEKFGAEFNRNSLDPLVYGKAWTVVRDTSNTPRDVYLTLYTVDDITHQEIATGRWDRIKIKLSSEYPSFEETQGQIMAALGYSSENLDEQATKAFGSSTDNFIFRPMMRPLERQLERTLGLDVVRFSYAITRNFLDANFSNEELRSSLEFLKSSRVILGKYLTGDLYLLYTGELEAGIDYQFQDKGVGLHHIVGIEYRLNPRWLLQMEYDYNTLLETHKEDKKIWLRHSFPF